MNTLHILKANTVADSLVRTLFEAGVNRVFGVPGGAIEPLLNALYENSDLISFVHARHESGAAYMAHGYALASNSVGVCCATTGPGATNLITGVSAAYLDHVPMLVITGQNTYGKTGRPALQDSTAFGVDTVEIFKKCTKYSAIVPSADAFHSILVKAMVLAQTPPFGPVHLSIPTDVLKSSTANTLTIPATSRSTGKYDDGKMQRLLSIVNKRKLVLYIGRRALGYQLELENLITQHHIPYVCSPQGKAAMRSTLPSCAGVFGFCGHDSAQQVVSDAEVVLAIGANMEELSTNGWSSVLCNDKLYCISDDPDDLFRSYGVSHVLDIDVRSAIDVLHRNFQSTWQQSAINPYPVIELLCKAQNNNHPASLLSHILNRLHKPGLHTYVEAGNSWCWYLHYICNDMAFIEANFGAMGWAIGAGIGACTHTGQQTIVISGDGSFLMNGNELSTAVEQNIPMVFLVLNDGGLGMVRHGQRLSKSASIGHKFPSTNYAEMAVSLGANAVTIRDESDFESINWELIKKSPTPFVVEIIVDPDIQPPMGRRIESLMKC